jgi:Ser/Thr protein kinase RdoA (MazF antagonist)
VLLDGREIVLRKLIDFQETFPLKQGAIHADLHFGNLIISALLEGYASCAPLDMHDEAILPHFVTARKLAMLGWLHTRWDNPRLRRYIPQAVAKAVRHIQNELPRFR